MCAGGPFSPQDKQGALSTAHYRMTNFYIVTVFNKVAAKEGFDVYVQYFQPGPRA